MGKVSGTIKKNVATHILLRGRDIVVAATGLLLASPLLLAIAVGLFFTQKRVIFRQRRPGLNEDIFLLYKFSTLHDAPEGWREEDNQQARLTPIGKYLRQWSLDELPQLWNVLRGDMSLVGPRPLLPEYLPLYTAEERLRHSVPPGITGWAQINGRNALSFKQRFALDVWYVQHRSFALDCRILWLTLVRVFQRNGVYADTQTTSHLFDGTN